MMSTLHHTRSRTKAMAFVIAAISFTGLPTTSALAASSSTTSPARVVTSTTSPTGVATSTTARTSTTPSVPTTLVDPSGLPAKVITDLDRRFTYTERSTKIRHAFGRVTSGCVHKKWFLTGDFDGDGKTDYVVRASRGSTPDSPVRTLIYLQRGQSFVGTIIHRSIVSDSAGQGFEVVSKGTTVGSDEEGSLVRATVLKNDAVSTYACSASFSSTHIFRGGAFVILEDS